MGGKKRRKLKGNIKMGKDFTGAKKAGRYSPLLSRPTVMRQRDKWEDNQPRLTDKQIARLGEILRMADTRRVDLTGNRFAWVRYHEQLEKEVSDRVYTDKLLGGIRCGIEWKLWFFRSVYENMLQIQKKEQPFDEPYQPYLDGMLPTPEFLATDMFDGIENFQPRIVLYQFEEQGKYLESAEEAIHDSIKRKDEGGAYFDLPQRAISHQPGEGGDEDPLKPTSNPDPEGAA